jgi:hypothetical protein
MAADVKAVLNFAPASLTARLGVKVKTVDLTTSLESLSYFLARPRTSRVTNAALGTSRADQVNTTEERKL